MLGAYRLVGIARSGWGTQTALLQARPNWCGPTARRQRRSFWAPATMLCGYRRVGRVHSDSEDRRRQMTRRSWFAQRPPTVRHPLQRRRPFSPLAHPFRLTAPCCLPGSLSASSFHLNAVGRLAGARLAGCSFPLHVLWWFEYVFPSLDGPCHLFIFFIFFLFCVGILPLSDSVIRCND